MGHHSFGFFTCTIASTGCRPGLTVARAVAVASVPSTAAVSVTGSGAPVRFSTNTRARTAADFKSSAIVTSGTRAVIEQIKALLDKLVPVHKVSDLTIEGPHVERELALIKVTGDREQRVQALRIADFMHARLVDSAKESFVFEITGASTEIDAFIDLMEPLGLAEVSRAGVVAIARGAKGM